MPGSTASLESLSSPSPSPPPSKQRASPPAQSNIHDTTGLDTGSELSELTEDEQDSTESNSKASVCKQPARRTRRSLVPDQMWGWYKKKSEEKAQKYSEQEEEEELDDRSGGGKPIKVMEEEEDEDEAHEANSNAHDQPPPQPAAPADNLEHIGPDDSDSDVEDEYDDSKGNKKSDENDAEDSDPDTDVAGADEDDGEEEPTESEDNEDEGEGEAPDSASLPFHPTDATPTTDHPEAITPMEVDIKPLTTTTAVAASSIMAGSTVIKSISQTSSASSSRSPSPLPITRRESDKTESGDAAETEIADPPAPVDEIDENPDDADHELESDLQPAHRAEALDVLATIEMKFALLRERLYVEKMEALAWEESLLEANTHPELIHLDEELSKRKEKRLELASRRRAFEVADANKRKRVDEDAVWSWWKYERDELQMEILSETNRKRRRLQRESRSLERPPPVRRIPHIQHELPPPPTLRDITENMTYAYASGRMLAVAGAYPSLTMLSGADVDGDLEFLNQHRRGWDIHRGNGQMVHHSFESYGPIDGPSGYGIIPPPQLQANFPPPSLHSIAFSQHGRQDVQQYPSSLAPRRSISPVGVNNAGPKPPNGWMSGPGVIPEERVMVTKDSRRDETRLIKEDREREREMDRERNYQLQLMHQQQQRHQQQQQQQPGGGSTHHPHHHHHVVHHHHPSSSAAPPSNALSPRRVARDLEFSRPRSGPPSTEIIDLSSSTAFKRSPLTTSSVTISANSSLHESGIARLFEHTRPPSSEYDRVGTENSRLPPVSNNSERVMTPFVIPPSQATQAHFTSAPSESAPNPNSKRGLLATDDLLHRPPSASQGSVLPATTPNSRVHSPSSTRPISNLGLLVGRPQASNLSQNSSPRTSRLPLPRSPGPLASTIPVQLPAQPSPQPIPTPAALIASSNGQNRGGLSINSPKSVIKQVIDPALSDISGGRSGLILNVVELRNPNPSSLHPATLSGLNDGPSPAATPAPTSRMNGVPVDGS